MNPICGDCFANSASRCRFVDTVPSFDALAMFPSNGSMFQRPLPSTGFPRPEFPGFAGTMRRSDFLPPSRRTSFPSLGDTSERLRFVPVRPQTHSRRIVPEFAGPVAPGPVSFEELSGSPKFPGNSRDHSPCSPTPARPDPRDGTNCQRIRHGPRIEPQRRLSTTANLGAQSHGFWSGCLRLVGWVAPPPRKTRFPLLATLRGGIEYPVGLNTHRTPTKGFGPRLPPFLSLPGARTFEVVYVDNLECPCAR